MCNVIKCQHYYPDIRYNGITDSLRVMLRSRREKSTSVKNVQLRPLQHSYMPLRGP
jgi:hypothetical protein